MDPREAAKILSRIQATHPFRVRVENYVSKMRAGTVPKPNEVKDSASWVEGGARVFGFKTSPEAVAFRHQLLMRGMLR